LVYGRLLPFFLHLAKLGGSVFLVSDLCSILETYLDPEQVRGVYDAYLFGADAHEGQKRLSGEPYIYHPLAVARILAELKMDDKTIIAAILHDVIEDTPTAKECLEEKFGAEVAELVDGVSKLTQIKFESKAEAQAENFRKLLLAMSKDIRVILIKLADRVHNMRTIGIMRPDKRRRIARETLEIYVPIANRLGMNNMRVELQELGFEAAHPTRYRVLKQAMKSARGNRKEIVNKIRAGIEDRFAQEGLALEINGREKHLYSVYQKMKHKRLSFSEVYDVYAFRLIVDKVDSCYRALGIIHNLYKPLPGKFKDYIAIPKKNGYQSLHTILFGPYGVPIEVQIRTDDMHKIAEAGIASHWLYKSGEGDGPGNEARANEWLRGVLEMQRTSGTSMEFLENVKIDLFPDVVYVFSPKGEIKELPRGATPVDFAYAVHTDVGNTCVAAKVERKLVPLRTPLETGKTVEIITAKGARPNPSWLSFVVTGKARTHIRHFLKHLQEDEAVVLGRRLLVRSLEALGLTLDNIPTTRINRVLKVYKLENLEELLVEIGLGNRMSLLVARQLSGESSMSAGGGGRASRFKDMFSRYAPNWLMGQRKAPSPLAIQGTEGVIVKYARCCRPIPGDPIVGVFNPGSGIVVHTANCKNIREEKKHPENWLDLQWEKEPKGEYSVEVRVEVSNERGVLATIAAVVSERGANIENVNIDQGDGSGTEIVLILAVKDRVHLANILRQTRSLDQVKKITRKRG
jgi:RelA/SpoT family (p)ppGpp synthetase